jgi:hypothetical protein
MHSQSSRKYHLPFFFFYHVILLCISFLAVSLAHNKQKTTATTYQYPRRAEHPHDIYILTSILSEANIGVVQCYLQTNPRDLELSWEEQKQLCCKAITTSSVHVTERRLVAQHCQQFIVPVPQLPAYSSTKTLSQQQPKFILVEGSAKAAVPDLTQSQWSYFVWDDVIQLGFWLSHDAEMARQKTSFLQRLDDKDDNTQEFFQATLESNLPEAGGMHRSMQHRIYLDLPMASTNAVDSCHVSFWMLLLLPPDAFILTNDAFEVSSWKLAVHTASGRIISEEEPTFASPPHAVYIHLEGTVSNKSPVFLEFDTKVHFRYPLPSSDPTQNHRVVSVVAPELVAGELTAIVQGHTNHTFLLQPPGHTEPVVTKHAVLYAQVATPQQSDLNMVLATTLLVSLAGVVIIWKETLRSAL